MTNKNLLEKVRDLGFAVLAPEEAPNANKVLAEVILSREIRLLEGFPVMLFNAAAKGLFNYVRVSKMLRKNEDRALLKDLALLSMALYKRLKIKCPWPGKADVSRTKKDLNRLNSFYKGFKDKRDFVTAGTYRLNPERIEEIFNNYLSESDSKAVDSRQKYERLSLEYAQSQIFSPKQKELFAKKLNGEKLSKTEREYFSRVVKKKITALANPELHQMARKVLKY
ncbi:MAG: hypothetical protein CVU78_07800 [Elusimicrobia bacterium HGW-Elusimicrobia-2]|nr:MAG: hypothetical protein CVU78_07800 [Elusimicrobia bacterium HGW-Elusimicrobia-2]